MKSAALAVLLLAIPALARADEPATDGTAVAWEVGVVSDYLFRGASQTGGKPTLQADFNWSSPVGAYIGASASGVDFGQASPDIEIDYTLGYARDVGDSVNLDLSFTRYTYPGAADLNYGEWLLTATFAEVASATVGYSSDVWNSGTTGLYYALGVDCPLPQEFSLGARVGRSEFRDPGAVAAEDYLDWNLSVGKTFGPVDVSLGYYGTDAAGRRNFGSLADKRLLLTLTFSH